MDSTLRPVTGGGTWRPALRPLSGGTAGRSGAGSTRWLAWATRLLGPLRRRRPGLGSPGHGLAPRRAGACAGAGPDRRDPRAAPIRDLADQPDPAPDDPRRPARRGGTPGRRTVSGDPGPLRACGSAGGTAGTPDRAAAGTTARDAGGRNQPGPAAPARGLDQHARDGPGHAPAHPADAPGKRRATGRLVYSRPAPGPVFNHPAPAPPAEAPRRSRRRPRRRGCATGAMTPRRPPRLRWISGT